jgi:ATP-dependent RNA helicase SUPV3L1/SUV3
MTRIPPKTRAAEERASVRERTSEARGSERERSDEGAERRVHAVLGPTNTGKTHRAIERMLEFETGIMGLPLRLLAREVYDRVSARLGEQAVALVTGEEKRIPAHPRYWICTTEAMPLERQADFVAVDEIQLVGHPERGHVFTDRLLHARGRVETWFLGSSTVEALLRSLLPGLRVTKLPRLSQLTHMGQSSLRTLPRRSAVVAFSMPQVYELADALRRRRGGAAVVLGALSPRVRNAQVALYQAGEVDFLVATDAIGMGLNLDVDHVALAGRVKFDGFEVRELESSELAQIVGRAGRHTRDGTFGTLAPEPELPKGLVEQLEQHRFAAQRFAYYRNSALAFDSLDALLASLTRRPHDEHLRAAPDADDVEVLRAFARRPELAARPLVAEQLRALWDVCRIPNYEKRLPEHQVDQLLPLYQQLASEGQIAGELVEQRVRQLERYEGDIHALMDRLSAVRTWTYVTHQSGWVTRAAELRARTRELEDKLSDALHERLLERFVEPSERRRARGQGVRLEADKHHPFARLLALEVAGPEQEEARRRARWVEALIDARFEAITLDAAAQLSFEGERVARLVRGQALLRPQLKLLLPAWLDAGARARSERRLTAHVRDLVSYLREPLLLGVTDSAPLRGLSYQLEQGLGTVLRSQASLQLAALSEAECALLVERGIVVGKHLVYAAPLLLPMRLRLREVLSKVWVGRDDPIAALSSEALYQRSPPRLDRALALTLGFVALSSWLVRCDVVERLLSLEQSDAIEEARLMLGAQDDEARSIVRELPRARRRRRRKKKLA